MIKYLRLLLLPFSVIYGFVVWLRNKLYDSGIFRSVQFELPVIGVGNLVVGGSGKSPFTEYLVSLLGDYKIAILSRGYGRQTKGFILADESSTARTIGDEPLQFYHKFPHLTVAVCEDRVKGISLLKDTHDLIILDDAYQHRAVRPGLNVLLFEYDKFFSAQFLLPAGNLREPFFGYKRADALVVTKTPQPLDIDLKNDCVRHFDPDAADKIFFSSINYEQLNGLFDLEKRPVKSIIGQTVFLLTGIANPKPLLAYIKNFNPDVIHHDYPDHHAYTVKNLVNLVEAFNTYPATQKIIITTEKDAQRLFDVTFKELLLNLPIFYLPIKISIEPTRKSDFDQLVLNYVSNTTRNRSLYK